MANKGTSYITDPSGVPITDENSVTRTTSEWASGQVYTYDTLADAQSDASLEVGSRIVVLGSASAFDGGGAKLDVIESGGEIELTASGLSANRADPDVISRGSIRSLLQTTPHDGMVVSVNAYHDSYPSQQFVGGGRFVYDSLRSKSSHDGGYVISDTVPWDWSDDGATFLSGDSDTDPSGSGCWVRSSSSSINPCEFGAIPWQSGDRDSAASSEYSIIAGLDYLISGAGSRTLDLGGMRYAINNPMQPNRTGGFNSCRITNGWVQTKSTFSGGYFFPLDSNSYVGGRTSFDHLKLVGGASPNAPEAEGMIKLPSGSAGYFNTVVISHNEFREYSGICIHGQAAWGATESLISGNRIKGSYSNGATSCEAIRWAGNDTDICENIIFNNSVNIVAESGGISILNNHLWNNPDDIAGLPNIECLNARAIVITGNYIDNGAVRLYDPLNTMVNNNKFVSRQPTIEGWNADGEAHVVLLATTPGFVVTGLSIQGNTFRQETPATTSYAPFAVKSGGGGFDTTQLHNTFVKNNSFDELMTEMTTHPSGVVSITAASSATVDFGSKRFLNWNTLWPISAVYNGSSAGSMITNVTRSGSAFTVNMSGSVSGHIVVSASSNTDAA